MGPVKILALTTSTRRGGAAIVAGERVLGAVSYDDVAHAERIFGAIDGALLAAGVTRGELGAVACDVGPGSFTGVRVGVATAKGIAFALGVPLVGVVSLDAMIAAAAAEGIAGAADCCAALVDAKKREVFLAVRGPGGAVAVAPMHAPRDEAATLVPPGAVVLGEIAAELALPGVVRSPATDLPAAELIGRLAAARLAAATDPFAHDPAAVEPLYVRAPDAKPAEPGP